MGKLVVSDANIFIDLISMELIEEFDCRVEKFDFQ